MLTLQCRARWQVNRALWLPRGLVSGTIKKTSISRVRFMVTGLATGIVIVSGILGINDYRGHHPSVDISGEWRIENTIERTTYRPYEGMRLGYRMFFHQDGRDVSATGEKCTEDGQPLPSTAHTPIEFKGTIENSRLSGTFTEKGVLRATTGTFAWEISSGEKRLAGRFTSTAANSSGPSLGTRALTP